MAPKTPPGQTRGQVFSYVRERLLRGSPPTVREVQEVFGFKAVQSAREHLEALVAEGKLMKLPGVSRGYRLPGENLMLQSALVPLLGQVQAGALTTAMEETEEYISVDHRVSGELFALRVRGESMMDAGILPGDTVVVRQQASADSGDIVVALVGDEATVKRLLINRGRVELHPENDRFEVIVPPLDELIILGRVVEVRRYLS